MACNEVIYKGKKYTDEEFLEHLGTLIDGIKGVYKSSFKIDPIAALKSVAEQLNGSPSEKKVTIEAVGQDIADIAESLYPNTT
jgi:hypothetical protein